MFVRSLCSQYYMKNSNRMIRSGECFMRVHNYPLAYRVKFKRDVPQKEMWEERFRRKEDSKRLHGVLKSANFPSWFKSAEKVD